MAVKVKEQGHNRNQAMNTRRSFYPHLAAAGTKEIGNAQQEEQQQGIMTVFCQDYSTWLPLVCAGGAAEGQTVVDFASKMGKTAQSGELWAAILILLLWSRPGGEDSMMFAELVAGTLFEELFQHV